MYMADRSRPRLQSFSSTSFFCSEVTHFFTKLLNDAAISAIPFGNINHPAKAWQSPEIVEAVAKRRKAFARAHCCEEDRQNYIAISTYISTVISKTKAESWSKLALASLLKPIPVKSSLYCAPSKVPLLLHSISQTVIPP